MQIQEKQTETLSQTSFTPSRDRLYQGLAEIGRAALLRGDLPSYDRVFSILLSEALGENDIRIHYGSLSTPSKPLESEVASDRCVVRYGDIFLPQPALRLSRTALMLALRAKETARCALLKLPMITPKRKAYGSLSEAIAVMQKKDVPWVLENSFDLNPSPRIPFAFRGIGNFPQERTFYRQCIQIGREASKSRNEPIKREMFAMLFACALRSDKLQMTYQTHGKTGEWREHDPNSDVLSLGMWGYSMRMPARHFSKLALAHFMRLVNSYPLPEWSEDLSFKRKDDADNLDLFTDVTREQFVKNVSKLNLSQGLFRRL